MDILKTLGLSDITAKDASMGLGIFSGINSIANDINANIANNVAQSAKNAQIAADSQKMFERLSERSNQVDSDATSALLQNQASILSQQEAAKVVSASTGQAGNSVSSMLQDIVVTGGQNQSKIIKQRERALQDITYKAEDISRSARDAMQNRTFNKPSLTKAVKTGIGVYNISNKFTKLYKDYTGG